jgi:hypothetical protein
LGGDGWFEAGFTRDIWYSTIVHFTGPINDPTTLVDWVAARRDLDLSETCCGEAELLRWQYDGAQPLRVPLTTTRLGSLSIPRPRRSRSSGVEFFPSSRDTLSHRVSAGQTPVCPTAAPRKKALTALERAPSSPIGLAALMCESFGS